MSYATVADLLSRLGEPRLVQLTDLADPPLGIVDDAVVQRALDDASAEIDGALVGRYPLPLASVPAVLPVHCMTLAHYRLLGDKADEVLREDVKALRKWLAGVATGDITLMPPADVPTPTGVGPVLFSTGSKVMGREATDADTGNGLNALPGW